MEKWGVKMSRRMIDPQVIIKSQVVDDKNKVDLYEILEKYGTVTRWSKTITVQIYNKFASDEEQNSLNNDNSFLGFVLMNGSIIISKDADTDDVYIQGMILDKSYVLKNYVYVQSGSYENGIRLSSPYPFDVHVIKV